MSLQSSAYPWVAEAARHIGLREIPGKRHNPTIVRWLTAAKAWWFDDETPWCGTFMWHCMKVVGLRTPKAWYRAKAWLDWGQALDDPAYGCVVVFERKGGGHVGIVVGQDTKGRLMVLGGNQGDAVSIAPFDRSRVAGYRFPDGYWANPKLSLPVMAAAGASSTNEA